MRHAQALEKNHFLSPQNRHKTLLMSKDEAHKNRLNTRRLMLFIVLCIGLAILAPVAVLAA